MWTQHRKKHRLLIDRFISTKTHHIFTAIYNKTKQIRLGKNIMTIIQLQSMCYSAKRKRVELSVETQPSLTVFADDTNIFLSNSDIRVLIDTLNQELSRINEWFLANKLSLNVSKTNFIIFCSEQKSYNLRNLSVIFNGQPISQVIILNWRSHYIIVPRNTALGHQSEKYFN